MLLFQAAVTIQLKALINLNLYSRKVHLPVLIHTVMTEQEPIVSTLTIDHANERIVASSPSQGSWAISNCIPAVKGIVKDRKGNQIGYVFEFTFGEKK